jgi:L-threonylcarbamoyladenylate synthase
VRLPAPSASPSKLNVSSNRVTRVIVVDADQPDPTALDSAAEVLRRGGLVAFATETVYGLGAIATQPEAVARIFAAKKRPAINPVIVHVADIAQASECVAEWPATAQSLAERFWPGPLTLVLNRSGIIPDQVTAGHHTVGVRAPAGPIARGLLQRTCQPIAAPSANRANRISPTRAEHVVADLDGIIDLIIDSGPTALGLESTVLDLTSRPPKLLRPGLISIEELERALGERVIDQVATRPSDRLSGPGQMPVHYAPVTSAFRVDAADELGRMGYCENMALVVIGEHATSSLSAFAASYALETPEEASRQLYDILHRCDSLGVRSIIVLMPADRPEWRAVRDRLLRATKSLDEFG